MRIKHLFYLLLAMPLAFAACEPEPAPDKVDPSYDPSLTLTSEATLEFPAEGGEGTIEYVAQLVEVTRESPVPQPEVEATCAAEWVTNLTVAENITFTVLANEADARETKVVVSYGSKSFEVAVKQAAKEQNEEPGDGIKFAATYLQGDYYGDEYSPGVGNYFFYLSDLGIDESGSAYPSGTYYRVDLYGPLFEGEGEISLPVGTYTFDADDTMAEWTIGNYYTSYIVFDENGYCTTGETGAPFTAATLVVAESGLTLTATIDGVEHTVTYEGKGEWVDYTAEAEPSEFTANYAYAYYYGDEYNPGVADNFYFFLSDLGIDADGYALPNGQYYRFDIYTDIVVTTNGIALPDGTYELDLSDTCAPGTFTNEYSMYFAVDEYGDDYAVTSYFSAGTLTKAGNKITAEVVIAGTTYTVEYEGDITIYDVRTSEEDPETPVDPEDPEDPTPGDSMSTLTGDLEINLPNAQYALEYYGDYYNTTTDNWILYIYEDTVTYNGAFIMLDFLSDFTASDIAATYTPISADGPYNINTYFSGYVDGEDMWGCWYTEMIEGAEITALAPIADGEIKIECAGDVYTITFDCVDDAGHKVTGTIVAAPIDYSSEVLSVQPAKKNAVKRVSYDKVKIEAKGNAKSATLSVR